MASIKHSKLKNTGILFELLVRQLTSEVISNKNTVSQKIIKQHFCKNSELLKELELYNNIFNIKFKNESKANNFVDAILNARKKINNTKLKSEKYNLIKTIKENYDVDSFFNSNVSNYKVFASAFKLFEELKQDVHSSPLDSVKSRYTIIEHITSVNKTQSDPLNNFKSQDKDIRLTAYKILIDRFNNKYKNLNENQKRILSEYINHISNSPKLSQFVKEETKKIKGIIGKAIPKIEDKVVKIKLSEVSNILDSISNKKKIEDSDVLSVMTYYELTEELMNV